MSVRQWNRVEDQPGYTNGKVSLGAPLEPRRKRRVLNRII